MNVGRLAPWYRWLEYAAFGTTLERQRFAFLHHLAGARRVLILGEGDGRTLQHVLLSAPDAQIDVVEISPEMIALASRRTGNPDRVHFRCLDARSFTAPPASYDCILTLFFLDCFSEADAAILIRRIAHSLAPGGKWLITDFALPRRGWRRVHALVWIRVMYQFFRITTGLEPKHLPPIGRLASNAGLRMIEQESARFGLLVSEVWSKPSLRND